MSATPSHDPPSPENRRGFLLQAAAIGGAAVALAAPAAVSSVALLHPVAQRGRGGDFLRLTTLDALPEDGAPRKVPVLAERVDAWNRTPNQPIGAVYLRRVGKDGRQIEALQAICPHVGCVIAYESDAAGGKFFCPCHRASFDLAGRRTDETSPSPRDMDALEAEVRNQNEVWVRFQTFRTGTADKVAEG